MGTRVAVSLFVAAALVLGACDGGSKSISKADFVKKGNAVCTSQRQQVSKLPQTSFDPTTQNVTKAQLIEVADVLDQAIKIQKDTITGLRDLGNPKGDSRKLAAIYKDADKGASQLQGAVDAARAGDLGSFRSEYKTASDTLGGAGRDISAYGLNKCGNG